MDDLQQRLAASHHTIACLHAQADEQAHTAYQVAERLRQELATRNAQLADLEQQLSTVRCLVLPRRATACSMRTTGRGAAWRADTAA